jgi:mono/diheme cytochrome c family protein
MLLAALAWWAGLPLGLEGASRALAQSAAPAGDFQWQALGARTYDTYCSGCHQRSGRGIAGGFPPLAGHAPQLLAQRGNAYMIRLVLFGLSGAIEVEGTPYSGVMPSWSSLKDDEIAAAIDHVLTTWGNAAHLPKEF